MPLHVKQASIGSAAGSSRSTGNHVRVSPWLAQIGVSRATTNSGRYERWMDDGKDFAWRVGTGHRLLRSASDRLSQGVGPTRRWAPGLRPIV